MGSIFSSAFENIHREYRAVRSTFSSAFKIIHNLNIELWVRHSGLHSKTYILNIERGWSGGAKVFGKLPVPGRPTILITVGQGSTMLAVVSGGGGLDILTLIYPFSSLSPSLWETARYRLKYCLKGPLNPQQPTNQMNIELWDRRSALHSK